jgi:hypothetical protein
MAFGGTQVWQVLHVWQEARKEEARKEEARKEEELRERKEREVQARKEGEVQATLMEEQHTEKQTKIAVEGLQQALSRGVRSKHTVPSLSAHEQLQWLMSEKPRFEYKGVLWQVHSCMCTQGVLWQVHSCKSCLRFSEGMAVTVEWSPGDFYDAVIEKVSGKKITVVFTKTNEVTKIPTSRATKMIKAKGTAPCTAEQEIEKEIQQVYYYNLDAHSTGLVHLHGCGSSTVYRKFTTG